MSKYQQKPLYPDNLKTYSLKKRSSKVSAVDFARVFPPEGAIAEFIDCLPNILAGLDFKDLLRYYRDAREKQKARIWGMGAHVIKVGLNPLLIDLLKEGWITGIALNGAGIIHDFELAFVGMTSEDVGIQIKGGEFGMARETGEFLNAAVQAAADDNIGLGESVGRALAGSDLPHKELSLLAAAYDLNIPVTVHVAIGTDTIHFHPDCDGRALGQASLRDFYLFSAMIRGLDDGGVYLNVGSAVVLPEVFLKAVSYVRNLGLPLGGFTTAVFDFLHHYRPDQNVVKRPLEGKGRGFYFIGQHEILIPLFSAALKSPPWVQL
ncbi:MAG: hypothetical protein GQ544_07210 [Candidatus Aminicenantes bacterium]|nr:hypothetical protein [Candidatus Aminicenantes bacterium]